MLVSMFSQVGPRFVSFLNFLLFRIMCVRYLIEMWEKDSISLWILEFRFCRSWRSLIIVACVLPLIHVVVKKGGSTIHPSGNG